MCVLLYFAGIIINFGLPILLMDKTFWDKNKGSMEFLRWLNIIYCILVPFFMSFIYLFFWTLCKITDSK